MDGQDAAWMTRIPYTHRVGLSERSCTHLNLMHPSLVWGHESRAEELSVMPDLGAEVVQVLLWFSRHNMVQVCSVASTWFNKEFPKWHLLIHTDPIDPTIALWFLWCPKSACFLLHDHNTVGLFTKEGCSLQFLHVSSSDAWWIVSYSSYQMLVHYLCVCVDVNVCHVCLCIAGKCLFV